MESLGLDVGQSAPSELYRRFVNYVKQVYAQGVRTVLVSSTCVRSQSAKDGGAVAGAEDGSDAGSVSEGVSDDAEALELLPVRVVSETDAVVDADEGGVAAAAAAAVAAAAQLLRKPVDSQGMAATATRPTSSAPR